jgi:hypothetical protein
MRDKLPFIDGGNKAMSQDQPVGQRPGFAARLRALFRSAGPPRAPTGPIITGDPPAGMVGDPYQARLGVSAGKPPFTWEITDGALPFGLGLSHTGVISGTPEQDGTSHFRLKVTDAEGKESAPRDFAVDVNSKLEITTDLSPTTGGPSPGDHFIAQFRAKGGAEPYTWTFARDFAPPSWLHLIRDNGQLTAATDSAVTMRFPVQVKDADGHTDTSNFFLKARKRRLWPGRPRVTRFAVTVRPSWRERLHVSSSLALLAVGLPGLGAVLIVFYSIAAPGPALGYLGVGLLTALAAFLIGCLAGFLFGVPKAVSTGTLRQTAKGSSASSAYSPSSNLAEVSDWLTKLLLGAGLVQLTHLGLPIGQLIDHIAAGLDPGGKSGHAATVMAGAIIFGYAAIGLLDGYVLTTTWYQNWLAKHAQQS